MNPTRMAGQSNRARRPAAQRGQRAPLPAAIDSLDQALAILGESDWLKISRSSVSASRYHIGRVEVQASGGLAVVDVAKPYSVRIRRGPEESFASMLVRAADLALAGHQPKRRARLANACRCGSRDRLRYHKQMERTVCQNCAVQWDLLGHPGVPFARN